MFKKTLLSLALITAAFAAAAAGDATSTSNTGASAVVGNANGTSVTSATATGTSGQTNSVSGFGFTAFGVQTSFDTNAGFTRAQQTGTVSNVSTGAGSGSAFSLGINEANATNLQANVSFGPLATQTSTSVNGVARSVADHLLTTGTNGSAFITGTNVSTNFGAAFAQFNPFAAPGFTNVTSSIANATTTNTGVSQGSAGTGAIGLGSGTTGLATQVNTAVAP